MNREPIGDVVPFSADDIAQARRMAPSRGLSVVASVAEVSGVLVDGITPAQAAPLVAAGAELQPVAM